ncbi:MAG TPA: DNA/RNA non-specific endonuclease [Caulobacterales bacterium]|nr:DNA/RNA non-specific endonuclease [Caulobacterales bacterium]
MRTAFIAAAFLALTGFSPAAHTANSADEFLHGQAPANVASRDAAHAQQICYTEYSVFTSTETLTPLWSAEHLTRAEIMAARRVKRVDRFHEEPALPDGARADLQDYVHSGYDRGHMAPSGDMSTSIAQMESFSLANMAPQLPALNRGLWEEIESSVRNLAVQDGELYVVTGPMFDAGQQKQLNGRVDVPAAFYKAVYDPKTGQAGAYIAWNEPEKRLMTVSIARLRAALGFDPFPALSEDVKARAPVLPEPTRAGGGLS